VHVLRALDNLAALVVKRDAELTASHPPEDMSIG
jgi:hypothetical protein